MSNNKLGTYFYVLYSMKELSNYVINPKGQIVYSYFFQELNKWLERERDYRDSFLKGADQLFAELKEKDGRKTENL